MATDGQTRRGPLAVWLQRTSEDIYFEGNICFPSLSEDLVLVLKVYMYMYIYMFGLVAMYLKYLSVSTYTLNFEHLSFRIAVLSNSKWRL